MVTTLGQKKDAKTGDNWIPVEVVNHILTTPYTDMYHVSKSGEAQDWNIEVGTLEWPENMSNAYVWSICNFGVRERMGWSHLVPTSEFDGFRSELGKDPVGLVQRHLVGQDNTGVSERYAAISAYKANGLRFGCVIDVAFPVADRGESDVSACVTVVNDAAGPTGVVCDNHTDRVTIGTRLAGYAASVDLDALDTAADEMRQSGLPSR